jgi:ribulose kinase
MNASAFVGVDVGSASVCAGVFDCAGTELAFAARPIQQFNPRVEVFEQSAADIWGQTGAVVRAAIAQAGVAPQAVGGIGFDATCSLVAVGVDGAPVSVAEDADPQRDSIMWMDHRAVAEAAAINATHDPALAFVGGEVSVEMELPKILWLRQHLPERHAAVRRYFDLGDYMVWRAIGADVASVCKWNYLAHEGRFSASLLDAVGVSDLPCLVPTEVRQLGSAAGRLGVRACHGSRPARRHVVATGIIDAHAGRG